MDQSGFTLQIFIITSETLNWTSNYSATSRTLNMPGAKMWDIGQTLDLIFSICFPTRLCAPIVFLDSKRLVGWKDKPKSADWKVRLDGIACSLTGIDSSRFFSSGLYQIESLRYATWDNIGTQTHNYRKLC